MTRDEYDAQTAYLKNAPNAREGPHVPEGAPAYKAGGGGGRHVGKPLG